ncbi:carbonic anhydrase family protein [Hydrogenophaga sp.]|uniref:carbonic anhydrase n=1 Tax=Hydrogenophaga sp. TaxID=1904254 RepID=UPI00286D6E4F|nr:carbonic anhydrase family protein [Hydrogenophaga sp.]
MTPSAPRRHTRHTALHLACAMVLGIAASAAHANGAASAHGTVVQEPAHAPAPASAKPDVHAPAAKAPVAAQRTPGDPQLVVDRISAALSKQSDQNKLHVLVGDEPLVPKPQADPHAAPARKARSAHGAVQPHGYTKARAAALAGHAAPSAHGGEVHWEYEGEHGPEHWGQMKSDFNACSSGKRQSPIHIQSTDTAPGPAEPIEFHYSGSGGSVVNNGHTIQVDPMGHNWIKVRGSVYQLVQFHFHHPAEEKVNYKGFAMVAHLVHKNEAGQLAVVAVLMDVGTNNTFLQKVWTRMPLDTQDRVPLPDELLDLNELLPSDQRYYQFMGSLTTPPCSEGVLWMVMKQPVTLGADQLKLFTKLFPMNARPVQAVNGRLVREAM